MHSEQNGLSSFMIASCLWVVVSLAAGCGVQPGAAGLDDQLNATANDMTLRRDAERVIEYAHRPRTPYWIAFVPPRTPAEVLLAGGVPSRVRELIQSCMSQDATIIVVADNENAECVTHSRVKVGVLKLVRKGSDEKTLISLSLESEGYELKDVR